MLNPDWVCLDHDSPGFNNEYGCFSVIGEHLGNDGSCRASANNNVIKG